MRRFMGGISGIFVVIGVLNRGYMKKLLTLCLFDLLLCGCAVARQVTGPTGEPMHIINCSGTGMTLGDCLAKAGKICGAAGYDLIGSYGENLGNAATFGQFGFFSVPQVTREIMIQCKKGAFSNSRDKVSEDSRPGSRSGVSF